MTHARPIDHKGRRVLLIDLTNVTTADAWRASVVDVRRYFSAQPADGSALTLTDLSGTRFNRESIELMKQLTTDNKPYVRASAVVNNSAMHRAAIGMVALFARRKFEVFETREKALDWLAAQ